MSNAAPRRTFRPAVPPRRLPRAQPPVASVDRPRVANNIQPGGLDYLFTSKVPEQLICHVCTKPLRDPHLTTCCGQHFCEKCLQSYFLTQGREKCPHCRAEGRTFQHVIDKKLRREIESLQIFCPHKPKRCMWMGEASSLQHHLGSVSGCDFVEIECPNKCKIAKIQRNALDKHLKKECERRPSRCQFCGHKDVYQAFKGDNGHYSTCSEFELDCPNQCGVRKIKRKDMESHQKRCRQELVQCPFQEAGCNLQLTQHDLKQHMSTQLPQHLLLVMGAYKEVKRELEETSERLQRHIIKDAEMKQALILDLKLVRSCTTMEQTNFALSAIQTRLGEAGFNWLKKRDDRIAFRMLNFNQHKATGKVWHSPPFYYKEGYKMCLAVQPSKVKWLKQSLVTVTLFLIKGEYDSELKWPLQSSFEFKISILEQQPLPAPSSDDYVNRLSPTCTGVTVGFCPQCTNVDRFDCLGKYEERREMENLGSYNILDDVEVVGDSIVLSVKVAMHQHVCDT